MAKATATVDAQKHGGKKEGERPGVAVGQRIKQDGLQVGVNGDRGATKRCICKVGARCATEELTLLIEDNGVGMALQDNGGDGDRKSSGSGQGLALHSTMMAVVGGTLTVESISDSYTGI